MGGLGSGHWAGYERRTTTDECRVLSIGHLSRGHWSRLEGALGWGDEPDDPAFELTWWLQRHASGGLALGLRYAIGTTVLDDRIRVAAARVVPGGRARWFGFCPGCDRRVLKLYKPIVRRAAGDEWFRCRRCHHLGYASQLNPPWLAEIIYPDTATLTDGRCVMQRRAHP